MPTYLYLSSKNVNTNKATIINQTTADQYSKKVKELALKILKNLKFKNSVKFKTLVFALNPSMSSLFI